MDNNIDRPKHWELDELVHRNIASYWPRRNQLFGIMGAPKNTDFSREYLFPGDRLLGLSDYRLKGFPENNFRYPRIPFAMRSHFLEHKYPSQDNGNILSEVEEPYYAHHFHNDGKPDLCEKTPFDLDMSEVQQWKNLQRRNAAEDDYRRHFERHKVLRLLQEEVEAERDKYFAAKERLRDSEIGKASQLPRLVRAASPTLRSNTLQQQNPHPLAYSAPVPQYAPSPATLPPIKQSLLQAQRGFSQYYNPPQQEWPEYNDEPEPDYDRNNYAQNVTSPRESIKVEQTQTEPQVPVSTYFSQSQSPGRISTDHFVVGNPMNEDHKKRYLDELRRAAEARREKWRIEREEQRKPFVDTITLLGADRPRWPGSPLLYTNPSFHTRATDVTAIARSPRPGMFLQFN